MSMNSLAPGDLAIVVRDCCGHWLGRIVKIEAILGPTLAHCPNCKEEFFRAMTHNAPPMEYCPVSWLKKIEPLSEKETSEDALERFKEWASKVRVPT